MMLFLGITFSTDAFQSEITGKVLNVVDGNTLEVMTDENETIRFVLSGVDCPELEQEFGQEAKNYLEKLIKGKRAIFLIEGKDRFGNRVGSLQITKGKDPRLELLERGLAWTLERPTNTAFEIIKDEAKNRGKGLWKQENPTPPWVFRRQQSMMQPKSG